MHHDAGQATQQFNLLISFFSRERLKSLAGRFAVSSDRPIFVLGLPRSGTTLVEQIIASHPSVFGAGELPYLERMVQRLPTKMSQKVTFPWCIEQLPAEMGSALAQEYVERLHTLSPDHPRVIDKMPKNACYIGLIRLLWPEARIVFCSRGLMDVAVSCYTRYFAKGQPFSWDLSELGLYCRDHERMARHWLDVARPAIFDVCYEELTSNQEAVTRQLIDFLGLPWDDACLSFHDTTRRIKTNPLGVRQPIYRSSVARWKRFEPWLGPLRDVLADA